MGWSDAETDRLRGIIAELEVKNSALVEECLGLRKRLHEIERKGTSSSSRDKMTSETARGHPGEAACRD
jgi:hypothetical protein